MPEQCTWVDCKDIGYPQFAKDGERWALLCDAHKAELDDAYPSEEIGIPFNPAKAISTWIKAQGGSKIAASRTLRSTPQ
jgi:hypothetical protein